MHAGNLCGCGMNEMDGNDFDIERIIAMVGLCLPYIMLMGLIWQAMPCPTYPTCSRTALACVVV